MSRHASMNRIYRLVWNQVRSAWVPVAETARGRGKSGRAKSVSTYGVVAGVSLALAPLAHASGAPPPCVAPACGVGAVSASSHPIGGHVVSGAGSISQAGDTTTIQQSSPNLFLDWLSFNVGSQETVNFVQPSANAIAVNEISSINGSQILGHLNANGEVWLLNPNGVVFGASAEVNIGGLVASTLNEVSLNGYAASFSGNGTGSIENEGAISAANGGYVALLGNHVSNEGAINARLGTVALGAGSAATLSFNGNSLVKMQVDQSTLKNLAANGGVIQADGGMVIMSAGAKDALLASVVNNTGVIEARTAANHDGTIELLGGMTAGTVKVGGTLDASAPEGGNGGFIETNAAYVEVANDAKVTTAASKGLFGTWLIDPTDFTVAPTGGDITGTVLSSDLNSTNFTILSSSGASPVTGGSSGGNINVNDTVSWSANTKFTLTAANNVNINANVTAVGAAAGLTINPNTGNGSETASNFGSLNLGANAAITLSGTSATLNVGTPFYYLAAGATINLPAVSPSSSAALVIGGTPYTVINSLGAAGSTTGTDLQGINGELSGHYALGSNISATATSTWNSGAGFTPIGTRTTPFTGVVDGLGHAINDLSIARSTTNDVGLFGYTFNAAIQNIGLTGGSVSGASYVGGLVGYNYGGTISNTYATSGSKGSNFVGGLVGVNYGGTITSSYATGAVSGAAAVGGLVGFSSGSIKMSYATGSVTGTGIHVGGLVGKNYGSISGTYATGTVHGSSYVGGLVGGNYGAITDSYATGTVSGGSYTGGLVGRNYGSISVTYATGTVHGSSYVGGLVGGNNGAITESYASSNVQGDTYVGGLVGTSVGSIANSYATGQVSSSGSGPVGGLVGYIAFGLIVTSYSKGNVSGSGGIGGLVGLSYTASVIDSFWDITTSGQSSSAGGTGLTTAQMLTSANFGGFHFSSTTGATGNSWVMFDTDGTLNNQGGAGATFPMLTSEYSTTINNAHQLQLIAMNPAASYSLGQNIAAAGTGTGTDVWGSSGFVPIGGPATAPFSGTFDGLGHTIDDLTINLPSQNNVGLFGDIRNSGIVRNVGLTNVSVTANDYVGGLVGYNGYGTISNSYATGSVTGTNIVGGLVAENWHGSITNSYATGTVSAASQVAGGLVGESDYGTIRTSYATGSVSTINGYAGGLVGKATYGQVTDSYSAGHVSGPESGGLVGYSFSTAVTNSFWDATTSGQSSSYGGIGMSTANMQSSANFTSATSANGNVNPGWDFANTWVMYNGQTYPLLRSFMTPLTVTANNATTTYNGSAFSGGNGVTYSTTPDADLLGTVSYGGTAQGAVNVGNYVIAPGGLYSDQQGYIISYASGALTINQLASVAWVGGATGNWSTASNWAGGAIPDLSNVAAVTIGAGKTVTYDSAVAGNTVLTSLTDSGKLVMAAGDLSIMGNLSTAGYQQTGGTLGVGGTLAINSQAGAVTLGNIDAGSLSVTSTKGAITQLAGSALEVSTTTSLTADNGVSGAGDVKYNITLAQAADSFGGGVTANGLNIALLDTSPSGLILGNTTATGTFTATSRGGALTQEAATAVDVSGATSLTATNGVSGAGALKYNITLAQSGDSFAAAVTSNGLSIDLMDGGSGGLVLGNTTATGTLTDTALAGAITQATSTALNVTGATSLTADNGVSGAGDVKYDITVANANHFVGAVSANGLNIDLLDKTGALKLGNTTATGTLAESASGGTITQVASTALDVNGTSTLTADNGMSGAGDVKYAITLGNAGNKFTGAVAADGSAITLKDATALTASLASSGAASLTAAGALNVSGTVGTTLTTQTTGSNHVTTFGATSVGTSLHVTSTGAVTETASNILTVDGEGTTTVANPNVTVNGVVGAEIPAP
jgi:trimeric autotransporter adhesin